MPIAGSRSLPIAACSDCTWKSEATDDSVQEIARVSVELQFHLMESHGVDGGAARERGLEWARAALSPETRE